MIIIYLMIIFIFLFNLVQLIVYYDLIKDKLKEKVLKTSTRVIIKKFK